MRLFNSSDCRASRTCCSCSSARSDELIGHRGREGRARHSLSPTQADGQMDEWTWTAAWRPQLNLQGGAGEHGEEPSCRLASEVALSAGGRLITVHTRCRLVPLGDTLWNYTCFFFLMSSTFLQFYSCV